MGTLCSADMVKTVTKLNKNFVTIGKINRNYV